MPRKRKVAPARGGVKSFTTPQMLSYLKEHVRPSGECMIWAGPYEGPGMNHASIMWRRKRYSARRLLLTLSGVKLTAKDKVLCSCGDTLCMNPKHLSVGTISDVLKGTTKFRGRERGIAVAVGRAKKAKLPITEAESVLRMRAEGMTLREIGEKYGVTLSRVGHAIKTWERLGVDHWAVSIMKKTEKTI